MIKAAKLYTLFFFFFTFLFPAISPVSYISGFHGVERIPTQRTLGTQVHILTCIPFIPCTLLLFSLFQLILFHSLPALHCYSYVTFTMFHLSSSYINCLCFFKRQGFSGMRSLILMFFMFFFLSKQHFICLYLKPWLCFPFSSSLHPDDDSDIV